MDYKIDNVKQINKGFLRAKFDLIIGPFIIKEFVMFENNSGENWIGSPSRKYEQDGETRYFNYVRCKDKDRWDSFSNWAIDLVLDEIGASGVSNPTTPEDDDIPF